jgi:pyruvate,water dikinase
MAGIVDSKLGVRGDDPAELASAVREVWASIASGRALAYLASRGVRELGMAVVLQRVVVARSAGVMFTRAPDSPRRRERLINAAFGLGSPVVDGIATPDLLRVDERGRVVEAAIAKKDFALVVGPRGVERQATPHGTQPALGADHISQLAEIARRLEKLDDIAWDVEFSVDRERVWLVQARPVTGQGFPEGGDADTVWSNLNVGEALPGVATPLTWSVAGAFSEAGFRQAFSTLGCSVPRSAKLVASVHGRFYLNLTQFVRIAAQVPWLDPRTLVELGGGVGVDALSLEPGAVSRKRFYAKLPLTAARLAREQLRLDDSVGSFEVWAERALKLHHALDMSILPDEGLARKFVDVQAMLERTGTVMLTCASSALGTHLLLTMLLSRVAPIDAERVAQALTGGIRNLESARPAIGLMRVVSLAQREPAAAAALRDEATQGLDAVPEGSTRRAIASFLELYGDRAVREAELSTPRWREDPRPILAMLRVALKEHGRDVEQLLSRAQAHADGEMQRLLPRLGVIEQTAVRHLASRAQKAARLRERMRAWVTRVLDVIRHVALDADRRLRRLMPELDADAIAVAAAGGPVIPPVFFLTVEEITSALRASRTDLAPLVRLRRAEYARDVARPDAPPTFTGSPSYVLSPPSGSGTLRGLPAGAGVVEGRARVLHGASQIGQLLPGEILVVHTTDVGWTPLFLVAAGVVTELGGPLSHAAVVARELGVPAVVNVEGVTRVVRTGERLRIDGGSGTVERLSRDREELPS